jgi:hypothetical protein
MTTQASATQITHTSTAFAVDIRAQTPIAASGDAAWSVLADTASYAEWNPFVYRLDGEVREGARVEVELRLEGRKPQHMRPTIVDVVDGRAFEWLGGFGVRGVLDGRHRFEIRPTGPTRCELLHTERLSGLLVPLFRSMLTTATPAAFLALNDAFKHRVEVGR